MPMVKASFIVMLWFGACKIVKLSFGTPERFVFATHSKLTLYIT